MEYITGETIDTKCLDDNEKTRLQQTLQKLRALDEQMRKAGLITTTDTGDMEYFIPGERLNAYGLNDEDKKQLQQDIQELRALNDLLRQRGRLVPTDKAVRSSPPQQQKRRRMPEVVVIDDDEETKHKKPKTGTHLFPNNCRVGFKTVECEGEGVCKALYPMPNVGNAYMMAIVPTVLTHFVETPYHDYDLLILPSRSPLAPLTGEADLVWRLTDALCDTATAAAKTATVPTVQ
jgi:hypothetical protein